MDECQSIIAENKRVMREAAAAKNDIHGLGEARKVMIGRRLMVTVVRRGQTE